MGQEKGPSSHLLWSELACHDGTPYPDVWRTGRAVQLAAVFEQAREMLGGVPIVILSGYRTEKYNASIEGSALKSQHVQGRALDIWHPLLSPRDVFVRLRKESQAGRLPLLGGLGLYKTFVHMDVRPKVPANHLAVWGGQGVLLPS